MSDECARGDLDVGTRRRRRRSSHRIASRNDDIIVCYTGHITSTHGLVGGWLVGWLVRVFFSETRSDYAHDDCWLAG